MNQLSPEHHANIISLTIVNSKRQQSLQIQLDILNKTRDKRIIKVKENDIELDSNRQLRREHSKQFYNYIMTNIVDEKVFTDMKYQLDMYDISYKQLQDEKDQLVKELIGINHKISELNCQIKQLNVKQEKYKFIKELGI